jgi:hypothetical protein
MRADLFVAQVIVVCVVLAYGVVWCKREFFTHEPQALGAVEQHSVVVPEELPPLPSPLPPPPHSDPVVVDPPVGIVLWGDQTPSVSAAITRVNAIGGQLTSDELAAILRLAGWPDSLIPEAMSVSWCESRWSPYAVGDGGNSLGLFQLWTGWFPAFREDLSAWYDPLVNARVARYVYERRGRWGGGGGWSCAP